MANIRFTIEVDAEDVEPSRIVPRIGGTIFEFVYESDEEKEIGNIEALMVLASRAANEGVDLFDAMDSLSDSAVECYEALYDDGDWSRPVWDLYGEASSPIECDLLFIEEVKLQPPYRGKGIGAQVVRETIATFGSSGVGLVACKPFALQYSQWQADDEEHRALRAKPGFEEQRVADFARVAQFWTELGFRQLPGTEFYAFAPHLVAQPALPRVPRGRRRLTRRSHK